MAPLSGSSKAARRAIVEFHARDMSSRHADLARQRRVVDDAVIHAVHLGRIGDNHAVNENAGHLHVLRFDRALLDDALDLRDDDAAVVVRRHGLRLHVERQALLLHTEVA